MTRDLADLRREVDGLREYTPLSDGPRLSDEQARVVRKWDLGLEGDLSPEETRVLEGVLEGQGQGYNS